MKTRKTTFKFFTIAGYQREQEYLRSQHKKGWKFVHVNFPGFYHFERCTPEDVVYQLDYNEEGIENNEEYVQMFKDCGWEYIEEFVGYSYFRKPMAQMGDEEAIFCDTESTIEMYRRTFRGRMVPLLVVLFCIIIPQLLNQTAWTDGVNKTWTIILIAILVLYVSVFTIFGIQYWRLVHKNRK